MTDTDAADSGNGTAADSDKGECAKRAGLRDWVSVRGRVIVVAAAVLLVLLVLLLAAGYVVTGRSTAVGAEFAQSDNPAGSRGGVDSGPGRSCVRDSVSDSSGQGKPPRYVEITSACLRQEGSELRLELTAAGDLPKRMPGKTATMTFGFEFSDTVGGYRHVFVQVDHKGWSAFLSDGHDREGLSTSLTVQKRTMRVAVKPSQLASSELSGMQRMDWKVEASWSRSVADEVSYAFDAAPDRGHAPFRPAA